MSSNWHDSARRLFEESPGLAGRILRDLLKVDLPPVIQYTLLMPLCGDDLCGEDTCGEDECEDEEGDEAGRGRPPDGDRFSEPVPDMVILAGPASEPVRAIIVEFQQGRDYGARRRWPLYTAAIWLRHGCPVDLLVICPDELTAHWADRPITTALDGYVCRPAVLLVEDLGNIFAQPRTVTPLPAGFPLDAASRV